MVERGKTGKLHECGESPSQIVVAQTGEELDFTQSW